MSQSRLDLVCDTIDAAIGRPFGDLQGVPELTRVLYGFDEIQTLVENLSDHPAGLQALIDRPSAEALHARLDGCSPGTLGAAVLEGKRQLPLDRFEIDSADAHTYVIHHLAETAPFWLTVIGAAAADDAHLFLLGFYTAQMQPAGPFLALISKNLAKVALERPDRVAEHLDALVQGWLLGKRTRPLFGANWAELITRDLHEVRALFGIYRHDIEAVNAATCRRFETDIDDLSAIDREAFLSVWRELVAKPYGEFGFEAGVRLRGALLVPPVLQSFAQKIFEQPDVQARASQRPLPRLEEIDFRNFHELPAGSLGRIWGDQMLAKGFDPLPQMQADDSDLAAYLNLHYNESHDVWHVLTGARTDKAGEIALLAFSAAQLPAAPMLTIVARSILKTALQDLEATDRHMAAIASGWLLGRQCRPLMLVNWKALLDQPVADLRARFEIFPGGLEDVRLD